MQKDIKLALARRQWMRTALALGASAVAGCSFLPQADVQSSNSDAQESAPVDDGSTLPEGASSATTPRAYRRDAASYLYTCNAPRIYKGKMPPFLYAVGVLEVTVDGDGHVQATRWARAPEHAPEVMAEIVRTVYQASPLPAPVRMGSVVYTDTWLWHKSGKFQLDTLSEGQY